MAQIKGMFVDSMWDDKKKKKDIFNYLEFHRELRTANPVDKAMLENEMLLDKKIVSREEKQKFNNNITLLKTAEVYEQQKGTGETKISDYLKRMPRGTKGYNTAEYWREMRGSDPVHAILFDTKSLIEEGVLTTEEKKRLDKNIEALQEKKRDRSIPEGMKGMIDTVFEKLNRNWQGREEDEDSERVIYQEGRGEDEDTNWTAKFIRPDFESRFYRKGPDGEDIDRGFYKRLPDGEDIDPGFSIRLPHRGRDIDSGFEKRTPIEWPRGKFTSGYRDGETEADEESEEDGLPLPGVRGAGQRPGSFEERENEVLQRNASTNKLPAAKGSASVGAERNAGLNTLNNIQAIGKVGAAVGQSRSGATPSYPLSMAGLHMLERDQEMEEEKAQQSTGKQQSAQQSTKTSQTSAPKEGESFGQYDRRVMQESETQEDLDNYGCKFYSQRNEDWSSYEYGTYKLNGSGCGPTAAAMVIETLTGQTVTPDIAAKFAKDNSYYVDGAGTKNTYVRDYAKTFGLDAKYIESKDMNADILSDAFDGENRTLAVIGVKKNGDIWKSNHYVVVSGKTTIGEQLYFIVYDPNYDYAANRNKDGTPKKSGSVYYKNGIIDTGNRGVILVPYDVMENNLNSCTFVHGDEPYQKRTSSGSAATASKSKNTSSQNGTQATGGTNNSGNALNGVQGAAQVGASQAARTPGIAVSPASKAAIDALPKEVRDALQIAEALRRKDNITAEDQKTYQKALQILQLHSSEEKIGYKAGTPTPILNFLNVAPKSLELGSSSGKPATGQNNLNNSQSTQAKGANEQASNNAGKANVGSSTSEAKALPVITQNMPKKDFVSAVYARAKEDEKRTGIPAAIMAAQAILESGYGSSELANNGNNLFGMTGSGSRGKLGSFANYASIEEAIYRYERNLMTNSVYKNLFKLKTVKEWAFAIGPAGYCPEKDYGQKLWKVIADWGLE